MYIDIGKYKEQQKYPSSLKINEVLKLQREEYKLSACRKIDVERGIVIKKWT